jgi:DNA-binding transcriptional MerR regulator
LVSERRLSTTRSQPPRCAIYAGIGLVEPSSRTGAGYRLYDSDTLARLGFTARAKQLGCSLEEISDLVGIWDGAQCGPVQKRFHDLVTTKLAAAERHARRSADSNRAGPRRPAALLARC